MTVPIPTTCPVPLPIQEEELEVLEPRDRLTVSQWAEKHRVLSRMTSDVDGPWSHEYTPFLVQIMDWLSSPGVRQVTLDKCTQSGGTEVSNNFIGWILSESPGPILVVMPREEDASQRVNTRLRPMFEASPSLMRHLINGLDDLNIGKETVFDNCIMYLAWSTSTAALSDKPCCYVILDETGKYPSKTGKEADPVSLAKDRQRTFYSRSKLFVLSSPVAAGDLLDREFKRGDRHQYWQKCPHCGQFEVIRWKHIRLDKAADGKSLMTPDEYEAGGHARVVCPHCGAEWSEQDRWASVAAGRWLPEAQSIDAGGNVTGTAPLTVHHSARITAWMLHPMFMTMDRLAAKWADAQLHARSGDLEPLKDFIRTECAEPWEDAQVLTDADSLVSHCGEYPMPIIPPGAALLTAGIDVQIDHFWLLVLARGYLSECWVPWYGRIETGDTEDLRSWDPLRLALAMRFPLAAPRTPGTPISGSGLSVSSPAPAQKWAIQLAAIDTGYRGDVAKDFCVQCRELPLMPVAGEGRTKALSARRQEGPKHRGLERYDINVAAYKDRLARLLANPTPGPGYLHLPADARDGPHAYIREHLCAEKCLILPGPRGTTIHDWQPRRHGLPNHLWDCLVYALWASDHCGGMLIGDPQTPPPPPRRAEVMERLRQRG